MTTLCRLMTTVVALLISLTASQSGSKEPSPGRGDTSHPQQQQTQPAQQQSTTDQRGTEQAPLIIKLAPPPRSETEASQEKKDRDEKAALDRSVDKSTADAAFFTEILAAVAALQLIVFIFQLGAFALQAKRLRQTIHTMDDTARRQLRAYVGVKDGHAEVIEDRSMIGVNVRFRNSGQTPAYDFVISAFLPSIDRQDARPWLSQPIKIVISRTVLDPAGETIVYGELPITTDDISFMQNGVKALFFAGRADYKDTFGKPCYFIFKCFAFGPGRNWLIRPHPDGYEAN